MSPGKCKPSRARAIIENVSPEIDAGRYPIKRVVGERVVVEADIFADGHDVLSAVLLFRQAEETKWAETTLTPLINDRWRGEFEVTRIGNASYCIEAWVDPFKSWRQDTQKKVRAGQDVSVELLVGARLMEEVAAGAAGSDASQLHDWAQQVRGGQVDTLEARTSLALDDRVAATMARHPDRRHATRYGRELRVVVDPTLARFGAWYEMFPRSCPGKTQAHGTFKDVEAHLSRVAEMGFDVLYLPPIHPVGRAFRKGKNNNPVCQPDEPGSPWGIGGPEGGHKAIHPELGTLSDFKWLVARAREQHIEIALDIAFQCSPDHPYVKNHPEWFRKRPDGSIQYAENPPKKYQDAYPFDFESDAWGALWNELRRVTRFWMDHGVRIFRVDNPHTKPFGFWEWLIKDIKASDPDVIFLAEAFTRPKIMYRLAKLGFSQSYTYFTWRNERRELVEYLEEITRPPVSDFFRPNFFTNTPDILHAYLQQGGRAAFEARFVLAATLVPSYGIYGPPFEQLQGVPREPGSEEYLDSEKYQLRYWDLQDSESIVPLISAVNRIRREHPALQSHERLWFLPTTDDQVIAYSKHTADKADVILTIVNLDPDGSHRGRVSLPVAEYGLDPGGYELHDLLSDERTAEQGADIGFELDPAKRVARIVRLTQPGRAESED